MTKALFFAASLLLALAACSTAPKELPPRLNPEAPTQAFQFKTESYLRGVNGSHNTSPRGRPAAILDVTYGIRCLSEGSPGAEARFAKAKALLQDKYTVAPLYFNNPRERNRWSRDATTLLVRETGCETGVTFKSKTTNQLETTTWALRNKVISLR